MVAALHGNSTTRKQKAGQALLTVGVIALFLQLWVLWLEAGSAWTHGASLGWLGALGMAMLQVVDFVAWNPNGILLSVARMLLLCWPILVMLTGAALTRKSN
jgi:hypothetical protein